MWNFLSSINQYLIYSVEILLLFYSSMFNFFAIMFYAYLIVQFSCYSTSQLCIQFCSKNRLVYSFCVFLSVPVEFVLESWVANGAPYYFVMQPWFDLLFFFSLVSDLIFPVFIFFHGLIYSFYIYIISLVYFTTFFNAAMYSGFWPFMLYGGFVLFCCFAFFLFFCLVAFGLHLINITFKTPLAGLILLSRDFMAIEDEDLWISSNIFHMDMQIMKAKEFVLPLKTKEIEVFMTLLKLFFEEPLYNLQYNIFSSELAEFRRTQRVAFLEKKRLRELLQGLTPKRKFQRFRRHKRGGMTNALLESQYDQFVDKTTLNVSRVRLEKHFYKFLARNLRFYYIRSPTKRKRLKRLILFKNRLKKQQILSLRFKDRATFSKKLNFVHGLQLSTDKFLPPINNSINYMQPQILRNDLVNPYLVPKVNLKGFIFGSSYEKLDYNQLSKIPRFRRFMWFVLPFYLSVRGFRLGFINASVNLTRFAVLILDWLRSKILSIFFAIFEDSWAMGQFRTRNYSPRQINLIQFLRLNNLSFVPFVDNPEDPEDGPLPVTTVQQFEPQIEIPSSVVSRFNRSKFKRKQEQTKTGKSSFKKESKTTQSKKGKTESEKIRQKRKLKKKVYRKRLLRKRGTTRKSFLVSRQRYYFSNVNNVAGIRSPELRLMHLYKLLEYFYFVLTNDSDFYEAVMFSAKVALLRDKYGQAIISDLLEKGDHKQASKVSVIMHVTEEVKEINVSAQDTQGQVVEELPNFEQSSFRENEVSANPGGEFHQRNAFQINLLKSSPHALNFGRHLLLSYRYRFRF